MVSEIQKFVDYSKDKIKLDLVIESEIAIQRDIKLDQIIQDLYTQTFNAELYLYDLIIDVLNDYQSNKIYLTDNSFQFNHDNLLVCKFYL